MVCLASRLHSVCSGDLTWRPACSSPARAIGDSTEALGLSLQAFGRQLPCQQNAAYPYTPCIDAGELPEDHKATMLADFARKRLASMLDFLRRMRLVTAAIGGPSSVQGQRRSEKLDSALYAVEPVAWAQEQGSLVSRFQHMNNARILY